MGVHAPPRAGIHASPRESGGPGVDVHAPDGVREDCANVGIVGNTPLDNAGDWCIVDRGSMKRTFNGPDK